MPYALGLITTTTKMQSPGFTVIEQVLTLARKSHKDCPFSYIFSIFFFVFVAVLRKYGKPRSSPHAVLFHFLFCLTSSLS